MVTGSGQIFLLFFFWDFGSTALVFYNTWTPTVYSVLINRVAAEKGVSIKIPDREYYQRNCAAISY